MTNETPPLTPEDSTDVPGDEIPSLPELSPIVAHRRPFIIALLVVLATIIGSCALGVFLYNHAVVAQRVRDLAIIMVAVSNLVIIFFFTVLTIVILYLVLKVYDISVLTDRELRPLLRKLNETASMTRDTAKTLQDRAVFIGDEAVKPVVNVISTYAAIKAIFRALFGRR